MSKVIEKRTCRQFVVRSIRDDVCGYPQFLIYDFVDGAWYWKSAKNFEPVEDKE